MPLALVSPATERMIQSLVWDREGHLKKVTEGFGDTAKTTEYLYDADGSRLIRRDPTGTTLYLPGTEVKLDKAGNVIKGTRYHVHPAGPVMVRTAEAGKITTSYLLSDANGIATTSVDSLTGAATRRKFTPFGESRGAKPTMWPGEKGFVGGTMDESTGLTHLGAREYVPALGRFVSVDPTLNVADSKSMNPYVYANNNPVTFNDASGLCVDMGNGKCESGTRPGQTGHKRPTGSSTPGGGQSGTSSVGGLPPAPSKPTPVSRSSMRRFRANRYRRQPSARPWTVSFLEGQQGGTQATPSTSCRSHRQVQTST
ncbi:RHS repeat-associated core domain-containing protein [Streptomyces sp. NPDC006551]|uniref:RHS repeat domain-containing protein n=1 Tax=Streptomyces sp. NPDC006551 TaxID=3157178 RepID=UPI0033B285DF